jgi:hypothetical protein
MAVLETMQRRGVVGDEQAKAIEVEVVDARFERMDVQQQFATACDADVSCQLDAGVALSSPDCCVSYHRSSSECTEWV